MDPCPVLVGRQQELAALRQLLSAGGGVAVVSGEAGIGKSRLIREFAAEAEQIGRIVLWGRPEEVAQPGPYALIADLLESIVERGGADVKRDARALAAELLRPPHADDQRPAPAARAVAAEIRGLIAQLPAPPLIVLEDLHWADEASHSVVLHLARAARDDGHVVVATLRSEGAISDASLARLVDTLVRDRIASPLGLSPLADDEIAEMLELLWGRVPKHEELAEFQRLGEGIPFFIEELAADGLEGHGPRVPRNIEQSVNARLVSLGENGARVISAASLLAGPIDQAVLAQACQMPDREVAASLADAARAGLLVDVEGRLVFRHALVRDAIGDGMLSVEASETHARLAAAIERVRAAEIERFAAELSRHHREASHPEQAVKYAVLAGERALAVAANEEARIRFQAALDLSNDSTEALRGLAEVEFRDGRESKAAELFRRAADSLKQTNRDEEAALVLGRLAWTKRGSPDAKETLDVLDEGLALLRNFPKSANYARLLIQKGSVLCYQQHLAEESRPILMEALESAREAKDAGLIAEALDALAQVADQQGHLEEALRLSSEAVTFAKRSSDAEIVGRAHHNYAVKLGPFGRPIEALDVLNAGREILQRLHGRAAVGALDVSQGWISWLMGLPDDVAHLTARGAAAWQRWRGYRWLLETWASLERGDHETARAVLSNAWNELGGGETRERSLAVGSKDWDTNAALFADTLLQLAEGAFQDAEDLAKSAVDFAEETAEPFDLGQMIVLYARTQIANGAIDSAENTVGRLHGLLQRHAYPYLEALSEELHGLLLQGRGDPSSATGRFSKAVLLFERCANVSDRARCLRQEAESRIRSTNDPKDKDSLARLRRAYELALQVGASAESNRIEAALRASGVRPRSGRPTGRRTQGTGGLSPREAEVAVLVAAGETNAAIASRLFLSDRTVQDHISNALRRLGLNSRAALASWAVKHGMI